MTRYMVIWHGIVTDGAASRRIVKQYFLNADSERGAVAKARDIMKNERCDPDGVPECRRAEPGDETVPERQGRHEGGGYFDPEAHSTVKPGGE